MSIISKILNMVDFSQLKFIRKTDKIDKNPSILTEIVNSPEKFMLEAFIENDEIIVKVRKRETGS